MIFYLHDLNFKKIKTIDVYENAIWTTKYNQPGDFEIKIALSHFTSEYKLNYFITKENSKSVGIIEHIVGEDNVKNKVKYVKISGRFASCLWEWRVNNAYLTYSNLPLDAIVNNLYVNHFTIGNRNLPQFKYVRTNLFPLKTMSIEDTGTNCLTLIENLFKTLKMGFTERLEEIDGEKKIVFSMYEGVDRSKAQKTNSHVVFSGNYDNLTNSMYAISKEAFKNLVYVAVKDNGNQLTIKKIMEVGAGSGINRKEAFVFGSDQTTEQTTEEWESVLIGLGNENLVDITEQFDGDIVPQLNYKFSQENAPGCYWVGDIVTVENKNLNVSLNVRIYEAIERYKTNTSDLVLTFGSSEVIE